MQELITAAERVELYEAFRSARKNRKPNEFICHALWQIPNSEKATALIEERLGGHTLGMWMLNKGFRYKKISDSKFNNIRNLWLNMLINEHSSHDMYLLARYRDYLINLRDGGFITSCPAIVSGFVRWCVNKFDENYYNWLIKTRKSKKLWQRIHGKECCPEFQKFIQQEILEVTNILIQEPK